MKTGHISACFLDYFVMINVLFRPVEALNNPDWILQLLFRKRCSWLPSASHASAPSGNDEAVYAEVHETPAEKFSMDENASSRVLLSRLTLKRKIP